MRKPHTLLTWAAQILFAKRTVARVAPSFDVDLEDYTPDDYEKIIPWLREVERMLACVPDDGRGMRWIHLPDTVLFYGERRFDVPFDDFVSRVDITHAGLFYRDSIGVTTRVADRDRFGRAERQGVRVVALPQPNYAAFMGKEELDVYKLEKVEYSKDEQRIWMLTVHSPNGSAICDDGYLAFTRSGDGIGTVVSFLACQNFPIPPLMALARLDRWTWFKTVVTQSAYRRFCNAMMKNIEKCYDGRDFRVGRRRSDPAHQGAGHENAKTGGNATTTTAAQAA